MDFVLKTNSLSKKYGKFKALNNMNITVPKGAIYGLVGKNGAGKTTLIRVICGLQEPTSGDYTLYGKKNTERDIAKSRRRIGAIIESPAIIRDMSARDNLKHQYCVLGLPSFEGIDEILKLVGLNDVGRKKAGKFSLGMRQRLAIAIALCGDPDFLILDEPTNGLDPQGIVEIRELILKLNREKQVTILISSHILDELSKIATHYGFIDKGTMVKEISADELKKTQRKCIRLEVSNMKILLNKLDEMNTEYSVVSDSIVDIYSEINIIKLSSMLEDTACDIKSISEFDESLESHFINIVGGGENE